MGFLKNFDSPDIEKLQAERDVAGLSKAAQHKKCDVRAKATAALAEIIDPRALPVLILNLGDATSEIRRAAAAALGAIGDRRAVVPLHTLINEEERLADEWAQEALSSVIGAGSRASSLFKEGVHKERGVRQAALDALSQIEQRSPQAVTVRIYADPNNRTARGLLKLDVVEALRDIELHKSLLEPGLRVTFYGDDFEMDGILDFDKQHSIWLGIPEWKTWRHL